MQDLALADFVINFPLIKLNKLNIELNALVFAMKSQPFIFFIYLCFSNCQIDFGNDVANFMVKLKRSLPCGIRNISFNPFELKEPKVWNIQTTNVK